MRDRLAALPVSLNVGQPISHRLDHMLSGVRAQIALKIYGEDLDSLRSIAEVTRVRLAQIPGIVDLQVEKQVRIPQVEIRVDYQRAALFGLQPAQITEQLERLSNGRVVSRVIDGPRLCRCGASSFGGSAHDRWAGRAFAESPAGWIPVRQVADIRETGA